MIQRLQRTTARYRART